MTDGGRELKARLTMREVAERYGFAPDRGGYIRCPFHQGDDHGSLKLYPGDRGWHCFGCGAGGSVIDFAMRIFDLDYRQAAARLRVDFGLTPAGGAPPPVAARAAALERRRQELARSETLQQTYRELAAEHRGWWDAVRWFAPAAGATVLHPLYAEALRQLPLLEYRLEELDRALD